MDKLENLTKGLHGISIHIPKEIIEKSQQEPLLKNLTITEIGFFSNSFGHQIRRQGIDENILLYCIEGEGWFESEDITKKVGKGDLAVCIKNTPHSYGADLKKPWVISWAHFKGELCSSILDTLSNLMLASTYIQEFFCQCLQYKSQESFRKVKGPEIEDLTQYMLTKIDENLSLEEIAQYMNMSKFHFVRKFNEATGFSPMDYFNRLKIQKACHLLDTTEMDIKDISELLSYNTPFYFSEVFKKIYKLQ